MKSVRCKKKTFRCNTAKAREHYPKTMACKIKREEHVLNKNKEQFKDIKCSVTPPFSRADTIYVADILINF